MRVYNLYSDPEGETHFREIEVECTDQRPWGSLSKPQTATNIIFVEAPATIVAEAHAAPCRQYVIILSGAVEVVTSDGERRVFRAGDIVLVEDTTGKGHITRMLGDGIHRGVFVPLD